MKQKTKVKKEYFKFDNVHVFFFAALVINYIWRYVQSATFKSFQTVWDLVQEVKPEFAPNGLYWFPDLGNDLVGWSVENFISIVVWVLSVYSLYLLYINIKEKKQATASTVVLIFGVLFYLLTIFY